MLLDPAGVSSDPRLLRSPTVAFQIFDPVGLRMYHEAQSLHLHYGLDIALSTLNSCRYLHEPKTRFPVGRLFPFPGRELHPLKAPGLSWRTETAFDVSFKNPLWRVAFRQKFEALFDGVCGRAAFPETIRVRVREGFSDGFQSHQM